MNDRQRYSVMAPVKCGRDDKTVWTKVGNAFVSQDSSYKMKVFLTALPITEPGKAIELFLYEEEPK